MEPKPKLYYTIKLEVNAPVTLTYKILAESPEQAVDLIARSVLAEPPKVNIPRARKLKATVYQTGTSIIKFVKSFLS